MEPIRDSSTFKPTPEGMHNAVCVDIIELPKQQTPWGEKDKIKIVWETSAPMDDGRPYLAFATETRNLSSKSNLRALLKGWRGRDFTPEELAKGFDPETLIGACCQLVIVHQLGKNGNTYANVSTIIKAKTNLTPTGNYVRKPSPQVNQTANPQTNKPKTENEEESEIPF